MIVGRWYFFQLAAIIMALVFAITNLYYVFVVVVAVCLFVF